MKILVIGAGVLGSMYAGRLFDSGADVTILARGKRYEQIKADGIVLHNHYSGEDLTIKLPVIDTVAADAEYDLAVVLVRKNQVADLLPMLAERPGIRAVLFMTNNAAGPDTYIQALGAERVLLGFPSAGGSRAEDGRVTYLHSAEESFMMPIGELDGSRSARILEIAAYFERAGFPVEISENIDAWLKTHVALVSPIANAIYAAEGDIARLAETRDGVILMVRAIREGLHVLEYLNVPILPRKYRFVRWVPESLIVKVLQKGFATPEADLIMAQHANAARDEMCQIGLEFQQLAIAARVPTPNIDALFLYANPEIKPIAAGSEKLKYDYQNWVLWGGVIAAIAFVLGLFFRRKKK